MKISLSKTARTLRERAGISQREAADKLHISNVHLCNIEMGKTLPSQDLIERMELVYGLNPYVYAWLQFGQTESLPPSLRTAADALRKEFLALSMRCSKTTP